MNRFLTAETALEVLQRIRENNLPWHYDVEKHRILILDEHQNERLFFRLPITFPALKKDLILPEFKVNYVVLLVQSGSSAVGYFENGINLDHKVFRAYMVRKKRGTSQVKYLKTKGKSRAGSRVRLAETAEFFDNVNERLQDYFQNHRIDRIALSCSKILIPLLFDAKVATPFNKRDERILKIPKHIHTPIYEVLLDVHKFLLKGELIYETSEQELVDSLLAGDASDKTSDN